MAAGGCCPVPDRPPGFLLIIPALPAGGKRRPWSGGGGKIDKKPDRPYNNCNYMACAGPVSAGRLPLFLPHGRAVCAGLCRPQQWACAQSPGGKRQDCRSILPAIRFIHVNLRSSGARRTGNAAFYHLTYPQRRGIPTGEVPFAVRVSALPSHFIGGFNGRFQRQASARPYPRPPCIPQQHIPASPPHPGGEGVRAGKHRGGCGSAHPSPARSAPGAPPQCGTVGRDGSAPAAESAPSPPAFCAPRPPTWRTSPPSRCMSARWAAWARWARTSRCMSARTT